MTNELEKIIDMALKDGTLTDTERQVINLRASKLGLNAEEVDMLINARIARMQIEGKLPKAAPASAPASPTPQAAPAPKAASEKKSVKKCLHCGAVLPPMAVKCPECGMYVEREKAKSAVEEFNEGLAKAGIFSRKTFISTFPVPKNAEDLLDFTLMIHSCSTNNDDLNVETYRTKLKECHNRIKLLYPDDERFAKVLETTKPKGFSSLSQGVRAAIIGILALAFLVLIFVGLSALVSDDEKPERKRSYDIEREFTTPAEEPESSIEVPETTTDETTTVEDAVESIDAQAEEIDKQMEEIQRKTDEQIKKPNSAPKNFRKKRKNASKNTPTNPAAVGPWRCVT